MTDVSDVYVSFGKAALVPTDQLYSLKKEIVEAVGFESTQMFPIFVDRFPIQLLTFLRLARIQDSAMIAKVKQSSVP